MNHGITMNGETNNELNPSLDRESNDHGNAIQQQQTTPTATATTTATTGDFKADSKIWDGANEIPLPRLVCRNLPYAQSRNRIRVKHNYGFYKISKLIQYDWFHVLLRVPTAQSLFSLLSIWTLALVVWAGMYVWVDRSNPSTECGLGSGGNSISFRGAFAFSLQTSTTGTFVFCM
jgi:hypothetical protein